MKKNGEEVRIIQEKRQETERKALADSVKLVKTEMDKIMGDKAKEIDEMVTFVKKLNENLKTEVALDQEELSKDLREVKKRIEFVDKDKIDSDEVKNMFNDFAKVLKMKVDVDEVQSSLNACQADSAGKLEDLRDELMNALKHQNISLIEQLNRKPNSVDLKKQLSSKIDLENLEELLENFLKTLELENVGDKIRTLQAQVEAKSFGADEEQASAGVQILRGEIEDVRKNLIEKVGLQEIAAILDQKCSKIEVIRY